MLGLGLGFALGILIDRKLASCVPTNRKSLCSYYTTVVVLRYAHNAVAGKN